MDSIISVGQKNTLAEYMILSGANNRPPMLDKDLYDSWKSQMELYMQNREYRRMIFESVEHGPLIWPTVEENDVIRTKKYAEVSAAKKIQADCYMKATNIIFQDYGFTVPVFSPGDDLIAFLNKAMAILTAVTYSRFPSTNNQLRTSFNTRNQATIQDDRGNTISGHERVVKCYNCQGEGHMARQCTQPKRPRNAAWYKEKEMLVEAQEAGQILDEEQLAFLADPGIPAGQAQTIIPHNAAFQTEDLDTYDSDYDDLLTAQAVLMAKISNYGFDVILEDKANNEQNNKSITAELERYKERVKTFEQRLNIDLSSREKMIDSQMDDMIKEKLALKEKNKRVDQKYLKKKRIQKLLNITFLINILIMKSRLTDDFGKRFTLQQELSAEQAFWLRISNPTIESSSTPPVKVEVSSELPKKRTTPNALSEEYFKKNDLKAQLQDKDTTICKLKDTIKSLRNNNKEVIVDNDRCNLATINEELENSVTHVLQKEHSDSLINKLNLKSAKNEDLKAQIQDKVFVITSLKNDLRKLKGKATVDNAAQIPSTTTVAPGMFKLDLEPLAPKLVHNRESHIYYLKHTQEQADILRGIVEQAKAKQPLDNALDFACKHAKRIQELLVYVRDTCRTAITLSETKDYVNDVTSGCLCVICGKCMITETHYECVHVVVSKMNLSKKSKSAKKHKKQNVWKPTSHVLTEVGLKWKPTGRTFTIVGNSCPLTRFTSTNVVPHKEPTSHSDEIQKLKIKVYSKKPKNVKNIGSSKMAKIVESKNANHSERNHTWGSTATDIPSSSFLFMTGTIRSKNDQIERIMRYGDYQLGNVIISRTLVEATRTMLIFSKALLFLWAVAINTACYTQNRSLIRLRYNKTPYELMQNKKPNLSFLHVFSSLCYPTNDHEDLGKFDAKADIGIFVGYAPAKKAFKIYNRRTHIISETIHVTFDELTAMASEHFSSGPELHFMTPATPIQAAAPRAKVLADSPMSISINQDAHQQ
nr:retrovirus-related Pol polyprotein from transposon TNT 1-94 [Tanacetum cinerariifolium]